MVLHWVVKGFDIFSVNRIKVVPPFQSSSCWEDREERTHRLHWLDNKSGNGNEGVVLWRHWANERNEQLNQLCSYVHIIMTSFFTHSHSKKVHVAGRTDGQTYRRTGRWTDNTDTFVYVFSEIVKEFYRNFRCTANGRFPIDYQNVHNIVVVAKVMSNKNLFILKIY